MSEAQLAALARERQARRAKLIIALREEEGPLGVYEDFIKWTIESYSPEHIPRSGLIELLEEAGRQFAHDNTYKGDRRYLKIWLTYAKYVDTDQEEPAAEIYKFLLRNDIGTGYSQLYEEYAHFLERFDRRQDAEQVFRHGIHKRARPFERLKQRHAEFKARVADSKARSGPTCPVPTSAWKDASHEVQTLRQYPLKNYSKKTQPLPSASASTPTMSDAVASSIMKHGHDRYALMLKPSSGQHRRPEKLRFNLGLLFTPDGVEYCVQEARAKSMGLLGKKWPPPPPPLNSSLASSSSRDNSGNGRGMSSKKVYAEPTVTIATKEALADVFGMYNSPEKTLRFGAPVGSKHAPVRKIEPTSSMTAIKAPNFEGNSTGGKSAVSFRPLTDENGILSGKAAGFQPFVDEDNSRRKGVSQSSGENQPKPTNNENASTTLRERSVSSARNPVPTSNENASSAPVRDKENAKKESNIFLPVFTPVASTDHRPSALSWKDSSSGRASPAPSAKFTPFVDSEAQQSKPTTQFPNIFTRTPKAENTSVKAQPLAQKSLFTPFVDDEPSKSDPTPPSSSASAPAPEPRIALGERSRSHTPPQAPSTPSSSADDDDGPMNFAAMNQVQDQDYYDEYESTDESNFDEPPPPMEMHTPVHSDAGEEDDFVDDDDMDDYPAPLGGRLGKFNVMTPITERTFEFTHTTAANLSARGTPSDGGRVSVHDHIVAKASAEQLAAELADDDDSSDVAEDDLEQVEERTGTLSLSDALAAVSSFKPPNPCNPFDGPIIASLLSFIPPDPAFQDLRSQESNQLEGLQKFSKKKNRRGSANASRDSIQDSLSVILNGRQYDVLDKLGEGGFGAVFEAIDVAAANAKRDDLDEDEYDFIDDDEIPKIALKVVKPRSLWEFHVLRRMHLALPPRLKCSVILPETLYAYRDESFLVLELLKQGTLLDVVNHAPSAGITQQGACLDELLVMFFTIELLRLLEGMHRAGFIHGDMKIDNCLLRLEDVPGGASAWTSVYQPSGEGGWAHKGIKMIDYGRTIDTRMFPHGQSFVGDWDTDARDCVEMREGRPWTYQTDYFGLAGIIYCMLYGKYVEASSITPVPDAEGPTRYKLSAPFKRYWQGDLWSRLFDMLLNSALVLPEGKLPLCEEIGTVREEMEVWLQANCNRASNSLKGLLKKVELMTLGGKDGR